MRESEYYRDTLEAITEKYGESDLIRISKISQECGIDRRAFRKMVVEMKLPIIADHFVNKYAYARAISRRQS